MPEQSPTLRDMIQEAFDNGVTFRELESRARDPLTGKTASRAVFSDILHGKLDRAPRLYHLRAIAAALRVSYEQVRQGAIAQWLPAQDPEAPQVDEREELRAEALRLRAIADEALARIEKETGAGRARPESA